MMSLIFIGFKSPKELAETVTPIYDTGVKLDALKQIGIVTSSYPEGFHVHSVLAKVLKQRRKTIDEGQDIDWATAESMAFGSLVSEGTHVRLSGQVRIWSRKR